MTWARESWDRRCGRDLGLAILLAHGISGVGLYEESRGMPWEGIENCNHPYRHD
jgi:hypothetical protein